MSRRRRLQRAEKTGRRALRAAALATALAVMPAAAQETPLAPPPPPQPSGAPAYDDGLLRLAEILGSLHYLRPLCGADEQNTWRIEMQALIDSESPDAERRARFVDRFNRGYLSLKAVYLTCTPAAIAVIDRYVAEGGRIARDIAARYGREK